MKKYKNSFIALFIVVAFFVLSAYLYKSGTNEKDFGFRLGLDLSGGVQLLYKADVSNLQEGNVKESLLALKDTIERRVNAFGVAEPIVQLEEGSSLDKDAKYRLLVELPGVTDTQKAIQMLGKTPVLEFRLQNPEFSIDKLSASSSKELFGPASITGAHLKGQKCSLATAQV